MAIRLVAWVMLAAACMVSSPGWSTGRTFVDATLIHNNNYLFLILLPC
jgi:hypothetical protein